MSATFESLLEVGVAKKGIDLSLRQPDVTGMLLAQNGRQNSLRRRLGKGGWVGGCSGVREGLVGFTGYMGFAS